MRPLPKRLEIIALMAMLTATLAFSIDAMLPALPEIAAKMTPQDVNRAQFIVTSFVFGLGIGTLFAGPLSDRFGRRSLVIGGCTIYVAAAIWGSQAQTLESLLVARVIQGIGAAGPRVATMAILRDLYSGRDMARTISFVMIIFTLVPAIAPLVGTYLIHWGGWPAVFWAFAVFALICSLWFSIRMPETLPVENRRPFTLGAIWSATVEMYRHPVVLWSIVTQGFCFGVLFSMISTVQPIYDGVFGRGVEFPYWFGGIVLVAGMSGFVNAALVMRLGMRKLIVTMLWVQVTASSVMLALTLSGLSGETAFYVFVAWQTLVFFQIGLTLGNLNAIALEPMGHVAGLATSIMGSIATVVAVLLAALVTLNFDNSILPLVVGILSYCAIAILCMRIMARAEQRM
ncbi:Bicyclomycin resistance protein [Pelagimonas phthalicica]|uniref:Bcr/CflA family efflux transporter n=1 Tax=Pelagimonas phthalicica TaxID=1037362 RepID=A0A238JD77_9RHOB|nr:multidrug effflux MFS transporter [Pelagimonas phthalicica]TDS91317.1 DHA1 family bicyclomycin/chloramphenicol resistance-like MFS transporter [Pelagimonas phthalicica]SMX28365.1 Bicyclomycin resistance protein [Pelagimonas phthalicica]